MGKHDGKTVIVTGAARGLGEVIAAGLAGEGATVVATDKAESVRDVAARAGAHAALLDVTDLEAWERVVAEAEEAHGHVHALVNNAGVLEPAPMEQATAADYERHFAVNAIGPALGIRAVAPALRRAGGGSIVNIGSTESFTVFPGAAAYSASKFALRAITNTAAFELGADRIRVNTIDLGGIDIGMATDYEGMDWETFYKTIPLGRLGLPDEVTGVVSFLISDESGYCTAADFVLDGGKNSGHFLPLRHPG